MGIDYYSCTHCGETFNDCGYFISCDCGNIWCSDECAKKDKYKVKKNGDSSCKFCRKEDFDDTVLFNYALTKLKLNRKQLVEEYKIVIK